MTQVTRTGISGVIEEINTGGHIEGLQPEVWVNLYAPAVARCPEAVELMGQAEPRLVAAVRRDVWGHVVIDTGLQGFGCGGIDKFKGYLRVLQRAEEIAVELEAEGDGAP